MKIRILLLTIFFLVGCQPLCAQFNIDEFLRTNTDGTTGYYLKQVNGQVLIARNESTEFYTASTAKVLQHLHAMLQVQRGAVALSDLIDIPTDACEDLADYTFSKPKKRLQLAEVMRLMMKDSDNDMTNVIQDKFGLDAINQTAHDLVTMSASSHLDHKFGRCNRNSQLTTRFTLLDLGVLYEMVARGDLLSRDNRSMFYQLMPNETDANSFVFRIINDEAAALGLSQAKRNRFKAHVKLAYKPGNKYHNGVMYASRAGYVSLPFIGTCTNNRLGQIRHRGFVFGVFINEASRITDATDWTVSSELFRDQIRQAVQGWKNCPVILEARTDLQQS